MTMNVMPGRNKTVQKVRAKAKTKNAKEHMERIEAASKGLAVSFPELSKMFKQNASVERLRASIERLRANSRGQKDFHILITTSGAAKAIMQKGSHFEGIMLCTLSSVTISNLLSVSSCRFAESFKREEDQRGYR